MELEIAYRNMPCLPELTNLARLRLMPVLLEAPQCLLTAHLLFGHNAHEQLTARLIILEAHGFSLKLQTHGHASESGLISELERRTRQKLATVEHRREPGGKLSRYVTLTHRVVREPSASYS